MGISHTWKPGYTIDLAAWGLKLNLEFQLSSEITFLPFNLLQIVANTHPDGTPMCYKNPCYVFYVQHRGWQCV